jgi:hypothetical protein
METGSGLIRAKASEAVRRWSAASGCFLAAVLLSVVACGAPGEPTPPAPPIPAAVTDLSARQRGDNVQLTFSLPQKSTTGDRLAETPAIEVLRGSTKDDGTPDAKTFRIVETIPGELVAKDPKEDHIEVADPVSPEETRAHPGMSVAYELRTRVSKKRASANSNAVVLKLYPVPEPIVTLETHLSEAAVELSWVPPTKTSGGELLTGIANYRVYRGEIDPSSADAAAKDLAQAKWRVKLTLLGPAESPNYRDAGFEFGKTYVYVVRSAVLPAGEVIESGDSAPAVAAPVDTFPPAAPTGIVAALLPGASEGSLQVDLSWAINSETDLAGYRVYKSEREGTRGTPITAEVLLTPSVRDSSVQPGRHYWYTVTAVDRAGNESAPSQQIAVDVAQPSP